MPFREILGSDYSLHTYAFLEVVIFFLLKHGRFGLIWSFFYLDLFSTCRGKEKSLSLLVLLLFSHYMWLGSTGGTGMMALFIH